MKEKMTKYEIEKKIEELKIKNNNEPIFISLRKEDVDLFLTYCYNLHVYDFDKINNIVNKIIVLPLPNFSNLLEKKDFQILLDIMNYIIQVSESNELYSKDKLYDLSLSFRTIKIKYYYDKDNKIIFHKS